MAINALDIVKQAESWLGRKESDGSHKHIIDVYNSHKPLARGYKVKYTDAWCATFVSAVAVQCGATKIMPTECSCQKMIQLYRNIGCWEENDAHIPTAGDVIFYHWNDNGIGDCVGTANHVGIVQKVVGSTIHVIEGNYSNSVKVRKLAVNGRYIRGYGLPNYDAAPAPEAPAPNIVLNHITISLPTLQYGDENEYVAIAQVLLGVDSDGEFGPITEGATKALQARHNLKEDGVIGLQTWSALFSKG